MHHNHHPSGKCTGILLRTHECTANRHSSGKCTNILCNHILPLTHECTEIIIPQVNAPETTSNINAPKSSSLRWTTIPPLTHEYIEIVTPQVNAPISYPSHMNAPKSSSLKYMHRNLTPHTRMNQNCHSSGKSTDILPLTHECAEIIIPQVNAPESYTSHMNAPKSSLLR